MARAIGKPGASLTPEAKTRREVTRRRQELAAFDVDIRRFKAEARRLLPPDHALLKILARTSDVLPMSVIADRLADWEALLDE